VRLGDSEPQRATEVRAIFLTKTILTVLILFEDLLSEIGPEREKAIAS
jgi:hypothetical protein